MLARSTLQSMKYFENGLVEVPLGSRAADIEAVKLEESFVRHIDGVADTSHALINDLCCGGLAVVLDCDHLATVWVAIGLSAHKSVWESNDVLRASVVGEATSAKSSFVCEGVSKDI